MQNRCFTPLLFALNYGVHCSSSVTAGSWMDGIAMMLAQSQPSFTCTMVLSHRSKTQWCSLVENAWITNGKGLEDMSLAARKGFCQECIVHSSPQRFPILPPLAPFPSASLLQSSLWWELLASYCHFSDIFKRFMSYPQLARYVPLAVPQLLMTRRVCSVLQPVPANPPSCPNPQWGICCTLFSMLLQRLGKKV